MISGIPVALGTAGFGTSISKSDSYKILNKYVSLGGKIIDTANNYAYWHINGSGGESESVIGDWLENEDRSNFTIMTKIGSNPANNDKDYENCEGLSPEAVNRAVEKSLTRLKTEYIDILLAHHDDPNTPLLDTWKSFTNLMANGKVRKVGVSNYRTERIVELANIVLEYSLAPIDIVQLGYSVINPVETVDSLKLVRFDKEMKDTLERFAPKAVIFGYSPLRGGMFEKDLKAEWPLEYDSPENRRCIAEIQEKAKEAGVSASAYVLKMIVDEGIIPITTTGNPKHLESNFKLIL